VKAGRGAYVVAPGSVHPNGGRYEALNRVQLRDAPPLPAKLMRTLERPAASSDGSAPGMLEPGQLAVVLQGLDVLEFAEHDRWLELMMACRHACPDGEREFVGWSTGYPVYSDHGHEIAGRWHSVDPFAEGGVTSATLVKRLIEAKNERPDDLAPRRALAVLYGPPKSAKTFLALEIPLAVASGRGDVHGLACKTGRVLYVLAEGGAPMMRDRVWAWLDHHGSKTGDRFVVHARSVTLSEPKAVERLLEGAGTQWDFMIFDTLARCMDGDENSVKDMNAAIRGCADRRSGACRRSRLLRVRHRQRIRVVRPGRAAGLRRRQ